MPGFNFGIVGDAGNYRTNGSRFYYSPGGAWNGNTNVNSIGPGQAAIAELVQEFKITDLISAGDLTYTTGASTLIDEANGQFYNNFMAPYPSPRFTKAPYRRTRGQTVWPYDLYDYPNGYPNPLTGGRGGSKDGINRFWPTTGNHDYGLRIAYTETNVALNEGNTAQPVGATSTPVPQPFIDYLGWVADPFLLSKQDNVKIAHADETGQSGIYYSVKLGGRKKSAPLVEIFSLDTQRLTINAGGYYQLSNGYGTYDAESSSFNYAYDPTKPYKPGTDTAAVLTSDPDNGQQQFKWLKQGLKSSDARWKLILGHQPVYSSGQWGQTQPDDHQSNPVIQRFLNGLPKQSFHAYLNGHAHYYQRVLEGNSNGIGQGIPFITNGNSGRILYAINQTNYGDSVYNPSTPGLSQQTYNGADSPSGDISPYLLPSDPLTVGVSGGYFTTDTGLYTGTKTGFTAGAYGYGFGAQKAKATKDYLLFHYQQTDVPDPAITDNLDADTRNLALHGWEGLVSSDWKPMLTAGMTSAEVLEQTAQFSFTIGLDGVVTDVDVTTAGSGYMASRNGQHTVDFEIRGNDSYSDDRDLNPNNYAIATLEFADGRLIDASLKSGGAGYQYLAQANGALGYGTTNPITTPQTNIVPINTSLLESWYTVPFVDYQDWYLITHTAAKVRMNGEPGEAGTLNVEVVPSSKAARDLITNYPITTGYSGDGPQRAYGKAMGGRVKLFHDNKVIGRGRIVGGEAVISVNQLPDFQDKVRVVFSGDPITSYQVNYLASESRSRIRRAKDATYEAQAIPMATHMDHQSLLGLNSEIASDPIPWAVDQPQYLPSPIL